MHFVSDDSCDGVAVFDSVVEQHFMCTHEDSVELPNRKTKRFNQRKMLRQCGLSYITRQGKEIPKKEFVFFDCKCRRECKALPSEVRNSIHESFWGLGDWQTQTSFIVDNISRVEVKRRTTGAKESHRKKNTNLYYLEGKNVCLKTFSTTLGISQKRIDYALRKKQVNGLCGQDLRGTYNRKKNDLLLI